MLAEDLAGLDDRALLGIAGSLPQTEIGRRLGISQMHVSRLRARALGYLRSRLLDLDLEEQAS
jgi:RNA polymerase sigma-B factor